MSNATRQILRALNERLTVLRAELATCTTAAMTRCVEQAIDDTRRQMREAV